MANRHKSWRRIKSNRRRSWNDIHFLHPRLSAFPRLWIDLRKKDQLCDCTIKSKDGKIYRAHRIILATAGEYFRAAFTNPLSRSRNHLLLKHPSSIVDALMEFAYTGNVDLTIDNVQEILPAADQVGMVALIDFCSKFLHKQMTPANAWGFYKFGQVYSCLWLARKAKAFILSKFEEFVTEGVEFQTLTLQELKDLASNDYLNINSEHKLVEAVDKWIMYDFEARKSHANELFSTIRYATLSPEYIFLKIHSLPYKNNISACIRHYAEKLINKRKENENCHMETSFSRIPAIEYWSRPRIPYSILFAAGGWSSGAPTNLLETYDIRANRWLYSRCDEPSPRSYHGLVSVNNILYIIGGFDGSVHFNTVKSFNPCTKQWKDRACMNYPRCYVSCVELGYVTTSMTEMYDGLKWFSACPMNVERSALAVCICHGLPNTNEYSLHKLLEERMTAMG